MLSLVVAAFVLDINTDENDLFSADLEFVERRGDYYQSLPVLADPIVVALETLPSESEVINSSQLNELAFEFAQKLAAHTDVFIDVIGVAEPEFVHRAGLLYLSEDDRYDALDEIIDAQPLLGSLSQDPSLGGLLVLLNRLLEPTTAEEARSQQNKRPPFSVALPIRWMHGIRTLLSS